MFDAKAFLKTVPKLPGIYQMYNAKGDLLYVGKARYLNQRLRSYFQTQALDSKVAALVSHIESIAITVTHNEQEALLLENNLIKKFRPRYNVLFRDDKSYPYICISKHPDYPRMDFYRGKPQPEHGYYFGPYPSAAAVHDTLKLLQKLFRIRQCNDYFFSSRTRPCLQYQIKRCSAPCVQFVAKERYQRDVNDAIAFLQGKKSSVLQSLIDHMEHASTNLDFEAAAHYRDAIAQLRRIATPQFVTRANVDVDVVVAKSDSVMSCVQLLTFRQGELLGSQSYFPEEQIDASAQEVLHAFLLQHYLNDQFDQHIPIKIIVNEKLLDKTLLEQILTKNAGHSVKIIYQPKGMDAGFLNMGLMNLAQSMEARGKSAELLMTRVVELQHALQLSDVPVMMQCFDVSHTQGEATVASCVTFLHGAPAKKYYKRFNIQDVTPGDDYAALYQAVFRHFKRLQMQGQQLPNLLLIDGGLGQLSSAMRALEELQLTQIQVVAVAKGVERKAGEEKLFLMDNPYPLELPNDAPALHLIQQIRDEAHRFAIQAHRKKRAAKRTTSILQTIPGIGPLRRRALLQHFGGLQEIMQASPDEIAKVSGISAQLGEEIYQRLRQR